MKIKECKFCHEEMKAKAKVCPHCQKEQPMNKLLKFILVVGSIFLIYTWFSGIETQPKTKQELQEERMNRQSVSLLIGMAKETVKSGWVKEYEISGWNRELILKSDSGLIGIKSFCKGLEKAGANTSLRNWKIVFKNPYENDRITGTCDF